MHTRVIMSHYAVDASHNRSMAPTSTTSFEEHHDFFCAMVRGGRRYAYNPGPIYISEWIAHASHHSPVASEASHHTGSPAVPLVPGSPAVPLLPDSPLASLLPVVMDVPAPAAVSNDAVQTIQELRRLQEASTRRLQLSMNFAQVLQHALREHHANLNMVFGSVPPPLPRHARPDAMPPPFSRARSISDPAIAHVQEELDYVMNMLQISERNNERLLEQIIQVQDAIASGATAHPLSNVSPGALIGPNELHASLTALTHSSVHSPAAAIMQELHSSQPGPAASAIQGSSSIQHSPAASSISLSHSSQNNRAASVMQGPISNQPSPVRSLILLSQSPQNSRAASVMQGPISNQPSPAASLISLCHAPENSRAAIATSSGASSQNSNYWNSAISYDPADFTVASSIHGSGNSSYRSSAVSYDAADLSFAPSIHNSANLAERGSAVSQDSDEVSSASASSIGTSTIYTAPAPAQPHPHHHLLAVARAVYERAQASSDRAHAFLAAGSSRASASDASGGV